MRSPGDFLKRLRRAAYHGDPPSWSDVQSLLFEYDRISAELEAIHKVMADKSIEVGLDAHLAQLKAEVARLQEVVVTLRGRAGLSVAPEYRYTSTFE